MAKQKSVDVFNLAKSMAAMIDVDQPKVVNGSVEFDKNLQFVGMTDDQIKGYKEAHDTVQRHDRVAVPAACLAMGTALLRMDGHHKGHVDFYGGRRISVLTEEPDENDPDSKPTIAVSVGESKGLAKAIGASIVELQRLAAGLTDEQPSDDVDGEEPSTSNAVAQAD